MTENNQELTPEDLAKVDSDPAELDQPTEQPGEDPEPLPEAEAPDEEGSDEA